MGACSLQNKEGFGFSHSPTECVSHSPPHGQKSVVRLAWDVQPREKQPMLVTVPKNVLFTATCYSSEATHPGIVNTFGLISLPAFYKLADQDTP